MQLRLFDTHKAGRPCELNVPFSQGAFTFTPDGGRLAVQLRETPNIIRFFSTATGKETQVLKSDRAAVSLLALAITPDGRTQVAGSSDPQGLQRWELTTGKLRLPFRLPPSIQGFGGRDLDRMVMMLRGGRHIIAGGEPLKGPFLSPDGRLLALVQNERGVVCDLRMQRVVATFAETDKPMETATFSPDSRLIAAGGQDGWVRIWDARTGKLRANLAGHRGPIRAITFTPDGKRLLSANEDTTALIWDVAAALRLPLRWEEASVPMEALWTDLASDDAALAEGALRQLEKTPDAALRLLRARLRPVAPLGPGRLARLISDLDSNDVKVRDQASKELESLNELAEPALRRVQEDTSAEVRRRVERLLARLDRAVMPGAEARPLRAVELLEQLNTPAALKLLEELAGGNPDAHLTKEAGAAVRRLRQRVDAEP